MESVVVSSGGRNAPVSDPVEWAKMKRKLTCKPLVPRVHSDLPLARSPPVRLATPALSGLVRHTNGDGAARSVRLAAD
ncbi:unnamed protein product [Merluccius merluccius]